MQILKLKEGKDKDGRFAEITFFDRKHTETEKFYEWELAEFGIDINDVIKNPNRYFVDKAYFHIVKRRVNILTR